MLPYIFFLLCLFPLDSISWPSYYLGNSVVFRATSTCPQNPRLTSPTCTHTQLLKEEKQSHRLMSLNHHRCHAHSLPTIVPPSISLTCWLAETKQMCYVLSRHDTPKKPLRILIFNGTWYPISCRVVGNTIIWWQNDWDVTLSRFRGGGVSLNTWLPPDRAKRKSDSGWGFG